MGIILMFFLQLKKVYGRCLDIKEKMRLTLLKN